VGNEMKSSTNGNRKKRLSGMTLILSLVLGVMLALPFKVIPRNSGEPLPSESRQELLNRMSKIEEENLLLVTELEQGRGTIASLEESLAQGEEASQGLSDQMSRYRILAGLDPVQGPGIRLTLSEHESPAIPGADIANYLIHQEDLLNLVNELWLAGAEAIAIRSRNRTERLINTSTIRCVGSLIDVNNTRMTPPFDIFAIGDPDDLLNSLTMPWGVLEPLEFYNISSEIVKMDDMVLPAYSGSTILQFARQVEEAE
jgi:uncharacterized protein YlxW (UPF0749 family)